ncbi:integrase [Streptomyces syringium]|uniref:integrase n=1 Tax=Streptomyces syringium TaxID=76729 RepID=UPI00364EE8FE
MLDPLGAPDLRVNRWFDSDEIRGLERGTWRKYAYSLVVWLNFLWAYGQSWDDAEPRAEEAFKTWRMLDERNESLVAPGTYGGDLTNVNLFYRWAVSEYGVVNPIRMRRGRGRRWDGSPSEQAVTAPKAVRDRDVKWFDPAGYERYRDCGLMGFTLEGDEDLSWRGRNGQRDGSFSDGLYGTGLRLEEWGSVLLIELPPDDPGRGFYTCHLAEQTAKGKRARRYWMPRRYLLSVLDYGEGERAAAVRRARAAGRYERLAGARVLTRVLAGRRVRLRAADGSLTEVSLDSLSPAARRRLLRETPDGLEPVALWLNEDGLPRAPHGWHHTFTQANKRLARLGLTGFAGAPHMLRHSFALRWFSVGRLLYDRQFAHLSAEEMRDFRYEFGSTWDLVQLLLGHVDQRTTKEIYLEPFEALEVELLLVHANNSGVGDLMTAVFGGERRVLGDPLAASR